MVTVTLTTIIDGTPNVCTVEGSVVYGTNFEDDRYNQHAEYNSVGDLITYDTGFNIVSGELIIKNLTYEQGELLREFIREKLVYRLRKFSIETSVSIFQQGVDLGLGKGVTIPNAKFTRGDDKGVFTYTPPGIYKIKFPYTFRRV